MGTLNIIWPNTTATLHLVKDYWHTDNPPSSTVIKHSNSVPLSLLSTQKSIYSCHRLSGAHADRQLLLCSRRSWCVVVVCALIMLPFRIFMHPGCLCAVLLVKVFVRFIGGWFLCGTDALV